MHPTVGQRPTLFSSSKNSGKEEEFKENTTAHNSPEAEGERGTLMWSGNDLKAPKFEAGTRQGEVGVRPLRGWNGRALVILR
jgi:hypothetical protein